MSTAQGHIMHLRAPDRVRIADSSSDTTDGIGYRFYDCPANASVNPIVDDRSHSPPPSRELKPCIAFISFKAGDLCPLIEVILRQVLDAAKPV